MANFKRKKSKRQVRCTLCTSYRWGGNTPIKTGIKRKQQKELREIREQTQ